ncbi:MAG: response regulator transcription factor [Bacteroidetes bacterium]|nr:response regulator transcription factor [Bacteroidota bacterium]
MPTAKSRPTLIALVDDHIVLANALAELINKWEGYHVIFIASNGIEMQEKIKKFGKPDLLILDLNMPKMDGYQTSNWLKANYPEILILVLTMFDSEIPLIRLLQQGVKGFIKKDIHPEELRIAVATMKDEGYYYPIQTVGKMVNLFQMNRQNRRELEVKSLTPMEIEFLNLVCTDLTYKEIALRLNLSPKTIDALRDQLFIRFDVKSRVGLALYAVKNGVYHI